MLAPAEADPLRAELPRAGRVLRRVGVRTDPEGAQVVRPAQHRLERGAHLGLLERHVVGGDDAGAPVDRDAVPLTEHRVADTDLPSPSRRCRALRPRPRTASPSGAPRPRRGSAVPPLLVRMPSAASNPFTSSASVNGRTSTTFRPSSRAATASEAVNTIPPLAAPGDAGTPLASTSYPAPGANVGCSSASSAAASMVSSASSRRQQTLVDRIHREPNRRLGRPFGVPGLKHVQPPFLHRELGVLHVLVVTLERPAGSP